MASFGWLHLSDLHQGMDGQGWLWPNVREQFYDDLSKLHRQCGPWDLVFFSGDLTQSAKKDEYAALSATLRDLWEHLRDLGSNPLLLTVPGNHDLTRPKAANPAVKVMATWHADPELRKEFWSKAKSPYRKLVNTARTRALASWVTIYNTERGHHALGGQPPISRLVSPT